MARRSKLAIAAVLATLVASLGATSFAAAPDAGSQIEMRIGDASTCC